MVWCLQFVSPARFDSSARFIVWQVLCLVSCDLWAIPDDPRGSGIRGSVQLKHALISLLQALQFLIFILTFMPCYVCSQPFLLCYKNMRASDNDFYYYFCWSNSNSFSKMIWLAQILKRSPKLSSNKFAILLPHNPPRNVCHPTRERWRVASARHLPHGPAFCSLSRACHASTTLPVLGCALCGGRVTKGRRSVTDLLAPAEQHASRGESTTGEERVLATI
jgi:hypothetical protein